LGLHELHLIKNLMPSHASPCEEKSTGRRKVNVWS
jgi:hypothetical protein